MSTTNYGDLGDKLSDLAEDIDLMMDDISDQHLLDLLQITNTTLAHSSEQAYAIHHRQYRKGE